MSRTLEKRTLEVEKKKLSNIVKFVAGSPEELKALEVSVKKLIDADYGISYGGGQLQVSLQMITGCTIIAPEPPFRIEEVYPAESSNGHPNVRTGRLFRWNQKGICLDLNGSSYIIKSESDYDFKKKK